MAHLLFSHPDPGVRRLLRQALEPAGHVADEAESAAEIPDWVTHAASIQDPFDLLLVGAFPGADLRAIATALPPDRRDHAILALDATPDRDDARLGVLGALSTTAHTDAMRAALNAALARRERYLTRRAAWDRAIAYLETLGERAQREIVERHRDRLEAVIAAAEPTEEAIAAALAALDAEATRALAALDAELPAMLAPLQSYQATPSFWVALRDAFAHERVRCYALLAELRRLQSDRLAHGLALPGGHFVLDLGGTHRLFFRWSANVRVLEDLVPFTQEAAARERLAHAPEAPVPLAPQPQPA